MGSQNIFERLTMTDDVRRQRLMTLIATCEEMLLLAGKGEWTRLAELESRRAKELTDYFSMPCSEKDSEAVGEVISILLGMNDRLVTIVTEARNEAGKEVHEIQHGRWAIEQYKEYDEYGS